MKIGDLVRCVDDRESFGRLKEGAVYTVEAAYDGTPTVISHNAYHCLDRFVAIEAEREGKK